MTAPVLFFCVGATKAGTSWLHQQLSVHPDCHFRTIKELHYFDALENGRMDRQIQSHREQLAGMDARGAARADQSNAKLLRRQKDRRDWLNVIERNGEDLQAYTSYLCEGAGSHRVVGDVTPAYALLPKTRLRQMSAIMPDVRFLYLLRDPIDRLWSHVRMIAARRDPDGLVKRRRADNILSRTLRGEEGQISMRSDYAEAISRLCVAVQPHRLLIDVYEELFSGNAFVRICEFLGIRPVAIDPSPVHAGQTLEMLPEQRQAAAEWLAPQYQIAYDVLGRRPSDWAQDR